MASSSSYKDIKEKLSAYRRHKENQTSQEVITTPSTPDNVVPYLNDPVLQVHEPKNITTARDIPVSSSVPSSWWIIGLKVLLWCLLFGFFVEIEFGVVFLIASAFYFIYATLKGSRRKPWQLSAYSVFNKNCERIDGTLSAEQFDKELRFGPGSVR